MLRKIKLFSSIGAKNIFRNRRRSFFTISAIGFGLLCLIVFQALKVGLHREMVRSTVGMEAGSLQIHAAGFKRNLANIRPVSEPERVFAQLLSINLNSFAPRLKAPGLVLAGQASSTVLVSGIEPEAEARTTFISQRVVKGNYLADGGVLVGAALAGDLGVGLGDDIKLMVQTRAGKSAARVYPVTGIYETALASFDRTRIFLRLSDARDFLRAEGATGEIAVAAPEGEEAAYAEKLAAMLPSDKYLIQTWKEVVPDVEQLIRLNDSTMGLLIVIVFAIAALGIANTMSMSVFERFHEFGVLASVGTKPSGIFGMIVFESFFLGVAASIAGSLAGAALCAYLARYGVDLTSMTSTNQYFATSHVLKAHLLPGDLLAANLVAMATALAAGIYPAIKAVRLQPVDALEHL